MSDLCFVCRDAPACRCAECARFTADLPDEPVCHGCRRDILYGMWRARTQRD